MREKKRENKEGMCYADEDVQAPKKEILVCFTFKSVHVVFYTISTWTKFHFLAQINSTEFQ